MLLRYKTLCKRKRPNVREMQSASETFYLTSVRRNYSFRFVNLNESNCLDAIFLLSASAGAGVEEVKAEATTIAKGRSSSRRLAAEKKKRSRSRK